MTRSQFISICLKYGILPEIVMENENAMEAWKENDIKKLEQVLINEF